MQHSHLIRLLRNQMRIKHIGKEMVIAIPMALFIQRNDKKVASLQGFQARAAVLLFAVLA